MLMVRHANSFERVKKRLADSKALIGVLEMTYAYATTGVAAGYFGRLYPRINNRVKRVSGAHLGTVQRRFVKGRSQLNLGESLERNALHPHACAVTASRALLAWA